MEGGERRAELAMTVCKVRFEDPRHLMEDPRQSEEHPGTGRCSSEGTEVLISGRRRPEVTSFFQSRGVLLACGLAVLPPFFRSLIGYFCLGFLVAFCIFYFIVVSLCEYLLLAYSLVLNLTLEKS